MLFDDAKGAIAVRLQITFNSAILAALCAVGLLSSCAPPPRVQTASIQTAFSEMNTPDVVNQCGLPPSTAVFSQNFQKAQNWLKQDYIKNTFGASATVPIEDVPVDLGANSASSSGSASSVSSNESEALYWVQREIANNRQAMVAECGYRICLLDRQQGSQDKLTEASSEIMGRICTSALGGPAVTSTAAGGEISFVPSRRVFVFPAGQDKAQLSLTLRV